MSNDLNRVADAVRVRRLEQAVINAAIAWFNSGDDLPLSPTEEELADVVDQLLTARSKNPAMQANEAVN